MTASFTELGLSQELLKAVEDLGFEEQLDGDGLTVIEWPDYIKDLIGNEYLEIEITINDDESRTINLTPKGKQYEILLEEI